MSFSSPWRLVPVLLSVVIGTILLFGLQVKENAFDLLPESAVQGDLMILQELGLVDRVFITLSVTPEAGEEQETKEKLLKNAQIFEAYLENSELFSNVFAKISESNQSTLFSQLQPYVPLLLDKDDFSQLYVDIQPTKLKEIMKNNFSLLNSPAGIGLKGYIQKDPLAITAKVLEKLRYLQSEFKINLDSGYLLSQDGNSCLILAQSKSSLTDSNNAEIINQALEVGYARSLQPGVSASVIGSLPHTLANSRTIQADLKRLLPIASLALILLLGITLRDWRALLVFAVPFSAAPLAIGLTYRIYGEISGLALGFGIVLLGIAVDFSVHLFVALTREEKTKGEILYQLRKPVFYACLTTMAVLAVLLLSEVPSHRQMATLALTGVGLAVIIGWVTVPLLCNHKVKRKLLPTSICAPIDSLGDKKGTGRVIFVAWVMLIIAGIFCWPHLKYNGDLRVLDAPDEKVLSDEAHFNSVWGKSGEQAIIVSTGRELNKALDVNYSLFRFLVTEGFTSIQSLAPVLPGPLWQQKNFNNWNGFWDEYQKGFEEDFLRASSEYGFSSKAFKPFFQWLEQEPDVLVPKNLVAGSLKPLFNHLVKEVTSADGKGDEVWAVTTVGVDDLALEKLFEYEKQHDNVTVVSNGKWRHEVESLLRKDILILSCLAGGLIIILVAIQFRRVDAILGVLAPVLSALAAMSVFSWMTEASMNMMHLIMGIMVIGLSVDYGIFVVCSKLGDNGDSTGFAVSICAASSLIGFGVLSFASHPALHALGITVLVGIGTAWPTALFVSPLFLGRRCR